MNTRSLWICGTIIAILIVVALYGYGASQESSTVSERKVAIQSGATSQSPQPDSQVVSLNTQQQCANAANSFFERWKTDGSLSNYWAQSIMGSGGTPSYANHYNVALGKCFVRIDGIEYNNIDADGSYYGMVFVYDVYESRLVAYINVPSKQDAGIILCEFPGNQKACKNEESFIEGVTLYMGN